MPGMLPKTGQPAIVLANVGKTFPGAKRPSLVDINLNIETSRFITIVGASGSGKTTLIRLINRLVEPSSGRILIDGQDIALLPPEQLRRRIGYVIQQVGLFPHQSVAENIATVPRLLKWDKTRTTQRVDELLTLVNLDPAAFRHRYPRQLSGGQRQRVGLARALATEPSILLMDEPFGAIDALTRTHLQDELLQIQRQLGTTILFVTHDIQEALKLGDQVLILNEGQIQQMDSPYRILTRPANTFVRSLIGTDDFYRQLQFLKVRDLFQPGTQTLNGHNHHPDALTVQEEQPLETALSQILSSSLDYVLVADRQHNVTGQLTLQQLRDLHRRLAEDSPP